MANDGVEGLLARPLLVVTDDGWADSTEALDRGVDSFLVPAPDVEAADDGRTAGVEASTDGLLLKAPDEVVGVAGVAEAADDVGACAEPVSFLAPPADLVRVIGTADTVELASVASTLRTCTLAGDATEAGAWLGAGTGVGTGVGTGETLWGLSKGALGFACVAAAAAGDGAAPAVLVVLISADGANGGGRCLLFSALS